MRAEKAEVEKCIAITKELDFKLEEQLRAEKLKLEHVEANRKVAEMESRNLEEAIFLELEVNEKRIGDYELTMRDDLKAVINQLHE